MALVERGLSWSWARLSGLRDSISSGWEGSHMTSDSSTGQKKSPFDKEPTRNNRRVKEEVKSKLEARGVGKEKIPRGVQEKVATVVVQKVKINHGTPSGKTPVIPSPDAKVKVNTNTNPTGAVPTARVKEDWMVPLTDWKSVGKYLDDLKPRAEALEKSNPKLRREAYWSIL